MKTSVALLTSALALCGCGASLKPTDLTAYTDTEYSCSFRYPLDWQRVTAQAPTTRILLYATDGRSTCNLSVVPADRQSVSDYDGTYFNTTFGGSMPGFRLNKVWTCSGITGPYTMVDYNFTLGLPEHTLKARALALVGLKNGKRYMLICNTTADAFDEMRPVFETITGTFMFLR